MTKRTFNPSPFLERILKQLHDHKPDHTDSPPSDGSGAAHTPAAPGTREGDKEDVQKSDGKDKKGKSSPDWDFLKD